jgi:hypothetical protein
MLRIYHCSYSSDSNRRYATLQATLQPRIMELDLLIGRWHSSTPCSEAFPAILHTCYESRMEGRSIYHRLKFSEQIIWMNFSVDILYLQIQPWTPGFQKKLLKLVKDRLQGLRYLALWMNTWDALCYTGFRSKLVEALPNLHELILVDNDDGMSRRLMER